MSTFKDVYQTVTAQIIEAIENGSADFRMPWHSIGMSCEEPVNVASKRPYRGVNIIALWASALARGYVKSWLTVLKQDKRAIFRAASAAQKASDWLCSQAFAIANAA